MILLAGFEAYCQDFLWAMHPLLKGVTDKKVDIGQVPRFFRVIECY